MQSSGGLTGVRSWPALLSSLSQPHSTFDGNDLYPALIDKAAILCFSLVQNHPFHDGNKRIGHAAMEVTLMLNGLEIVASVDIQERLILDLAIGKFEQRAFTRWVNEHVQPIEKMT